MTQLNQIYKCELCGNIVEVLHAGAGELVCCGQPMVLQEENTVDAAVEKHVPVIEKGENGVKVTVGEVAHPMTDDHFIEWIELKTANGKFRKDLKPGDEPVLSCDCGEKCTCCDGGDVTARAYCNLHGLWKSK